MKNKMIPKIIDRELMYNIVQGSLRSCIDTHGPINKGLLTSASKRVTNQLVGHVINELNLEKKREMEKEVVDKGFKVVPVDELERLERGIRINRQGLEYWKAKAQELMGEDA